MPGVLTTVDTFKKEDDDEGVPQSECDLANEETKPPEAEEAHCEASFTQSFKTKPATVGVSEDEMSEFLCKDKLPRFCDLASVVCASACVYASLSPARSFTASPTKWECSLLVDAAGRAQETPQREHHPSRHVSTSLSR